MREYCTREPEPHPWKDLLRERDLDIHAPGYVRIVESIRPHIDTTRYGSFLANEFQRRGGEIVRRSIASVSELATNAAFSAVVVCAGLGARMLAHDSRLLPLRGHVLHVPNTINLTRSVHDDAPGGLVSYVFVYDDHLVLGSTLEPGEENVSPDRRHVRSMIERCTALVSLDTGASVAPLARDADNARAGLRPARIHPLAPGSYEAIRLELDRSFAVPIIYNYGHGRSGVTLSWGCGEEAVALVEEALH
jgi:D-amino-acid oxidase